MRVVFAVYNFRASQLPLQPWLTIARVAEGLHSRGHDVHIVTDTSDAAEMPGLETHRVDSFRGSNDREVNKRIEALRPDAVVALPTPLNVVTSAWMRGRGVRRVGFASYPFYTASELWRGWRTLGWRQSGIYLRHALVPGRTWTRGCAQSFDALVAQSRSTCARLQHVCPTAGAEFIPPGIELKHWPLRSGGERKVDTVELLYLGSAVPIRGFDVLLGAMARLKDTTTHLKVMARGADAGTVARIRERVATAGLGTAVTVCGGWSERGDLVRAIQDATAVVLPFVLVPSELPVTVMEVIACGTPVIASHIDGLPSAIGPAGTTVAQGSARELASTIRRLQAEPSLLAEWQCGCLVQRSAMMSWGTVTERWERVLHG